MQTGPRSLRYGITARVIPDTPLFSLDPKNSFRRAGYQDKEKLKPPGMEPCRDSTGYSPPETSRSPVYFPLLLKLGGVSFRGVDDKWTVPLYCDDTPVHLFDGDYLNYIAHEFPLQWENGIPSFL